jgi:type II secretory pathway pseudopilin PulG
VAPDPARRRNANRRRAFSLVEAIAAAALVGIGVTGVLTGIRSILATESRARTTDLLQRLAVGKLEEIGSVTDPRTAENEGDFTEQGYPEIQWSLTVETTDDASVSAVTVDAVKADNSQSVTGWVYTGTDTGTTTPSPTGANP